MSEPSRNKIRPRLSAWVREQNQLGARPRITKDTLSWIGDLAIPVLPERADKLLRAAVAIAPDYGGDFSMLEPSLIAASWSETLRDVQFLLKVLEGRGYIEFISADGGCQVTPQGFIYAEELQHKTAASAQAFIAMWFHNDMTPIFDVAIAPAVSNAGYDPKRVDRVEHIGRIDDQIIAEIRRSRFVVADFTGHRGGVYFEAGFAMGLDLPVVFTCRKNAIGDLHFDIRQFNTIDWESPDELKVRLQNRIEAVLGDGPKKARQ